jgi:hypothetical protein
MGYKTTLLYVGGLFAATTGPVAWHSGSEYLNGKNTPPAAASTDSQGNPQGKTSNDPAALARPVSPESPYGKSLSLPSPTLDEALRFDRSVEWVIGHWSHVTTGLSYLQLQGYRVTLMTGPALPDVAGSLTYYFNPHQRVQRITVTGTTGDPSRLVAIVSARHHFTRRLVNDPGLVLYEAVDPNNHPVGTLKIRSAPVILASQPYTRYEFDLTMERADWEQE